MNEEQNIAIEGILKLYTASMLNDIKKDPLKAVDKIQENLAEILKLKIEKNNLQNRIDKAIEFIEKNSKQCLTNKIDEQPTKVIGKFMWHTDELLDILKEVE